ncbi:MAG: DNA alkylation repair protein [Desulfitobacteriaceae bacterium]
MSGTEEEVRRRLFELRDLKYKEFACKLMPTVNPEAVIGVRTPDLRKLARELSKTPEAAEFLKILPHAYYEENNLHGFLIETIRDYDAAIAAVDEFLPYIQEQRLAKWTHNKAIQKAVESYRIGDEAKAYLRTLKVNGGNRS